MNGISASEMVVILAFVIFLLIAFWRVAIPVILAIVLAKVVVSVAAMTQQLPVQPAAALAAMAPHLF
ncbi:hypothetical protein WCD74_00725 [Actinomycetospora sp. OC33-EN08]|uniref:Uncharacterized protein n=1 Tax=Actinomycetospora aurantiaca TaxID=3129233 RepID=A0ABU8MG15_9PSEU